MMFSLNDSQDGIHGLFDLRIRIQYGVVKDVQIPQLLLGHRKPKLKIRLRFGSALPEPLCKLLLIAGSQKYQQRLRRKGADRLSSLHIDAHHNVLPAFHSLSDLLPGNALVVVVDEGVLDQLTLVDHIEELLLFNKKIIYALGFARSLGAGSCGDDKVEWRTLLLHMIQNSILADAGRAGNHDKKWLCGLLNHGCGR